ncbi:MAG: Family of serine hydrolases 3 [Sporothrix thermara]
MSTTPPAAAAVAVAAPAPAPAPQQKKPKPPKQPKQPTQPKLPPPAMTKVKILMLHGYTQSGALFHGRTRALEKLLQKSLAPFKLEPVLLYPTGPTRLRPQDLPWYEPPEDGADDDEGDSWAWWRQDDASGEYRFMTEGMNCIADAIEAAGGIDGVLGFSQGAAAAAMLAAALEENRHPPTTATSPHFKWSWVERVRAANKHRPLSFAVIYSGFRAAPPELSWLYEPAITTPTLHYIGGLDTVVAESRTQAMVDVCVAPTVLTHPGGHFVPIKKEWVMPLVAFVKTYGEAKAEKAKAEKAEAEANGAKADGAKAEGVKANGASVEETKAEETKAEEAKI